MENRVIKFRAWNPSTNYMLYSHDTTGESDLENLELFFIGVNMSSDDIKIMQFTGLLDKNGKEVYEGDIVRVAGLEHNMPVDTIFEIKWSAENFCHIAHNGAEWLMMLDVVDCEVIGNIYETPPPPPHQNHPPRPPKMITTMST